MPDFPRDRPHLYLRNNGKAEPYTSKNPPPRQPLPLRERAELGKQLARVIQRMSEQPQGYAQATAHLDSRPDWVFVFGSSKGWERAGMLGCMEQTMRAALTHYQKQRCMIIIDRDGEGYEVSMTLPGHDFIPTDADVLNGDKLFGGLRVASIQLDSF